MSKQEVIQPIPTSMQELVEKTAEQFGSKEWTDSGNGAYRINHAVFDVTKSLGLNPVDLLNLVWRMTNLSGEELSEIRRKFHPAFMIDGEDRELCQEMFARGVLEAELIKAHSELAKEEERKIADYRLSRLSDIDGHY